MKAMIFAAGFGTRMKPLTLRTPKALLPYKGIPVIRHIISLLPPVKELAVNTHYLHDLVADWFAQNEFSFPVRLYYEPEILGTGGGLHNASPSLHGSDFIVWNCDILCDLNIPQLIAGFGHDVPDVILFCSNRTEQSYLLFNSVGQLCGHTTEGDKKAALARGHVVRAFCGISYFSRAGSDFFFENQLRHFSVVDSWLEMSHAGLRVALCDISGNSWTDLGTPENLRATEEAPLLRYLQ